MHALFYLLLANLVRFVDGRSSSSLVWRSLTETEKKSILVRFVDGIASLGPLLGPAFAFGVPHRCEARDKAQRLNPGDP